MRLGVAGFVAGSRVNGPGLRAVLWVQGCDLACPGCFNPSTHAAAADGWSADAAIDRLTAALGPEHVGVTFSGGEPFQQATALAAVARGLRARRPALHLMAFSGYRLEALRGPDAPAGAAALLASLDALVDGPYEAKRPGQRAWRASRNQRLWVLGRALPPGASARAGVAELHVADDGALLLSGFPDAGLRRLVRGIGEPGAR